MFNAAKQFLHSTVFGYWLLDPQGQEATSFLVVVFGALIWFILSTQSSKDLTRAAVASAGNTKVGAGQQAQQMQETNRDVFVQPTRGLHTPSRNQTPVRKLVPVELKPTKFPSHGFEEVRLNGDRTGRISTPGYQTPFSKSSHAQIFSSLAKVAPVSYDALQETGMLAPDGTPTKKWSQVKHSLGARKFDSEGSRVDSKTAWIDHLQ